MTGDPRSPEAVAAAVRLDCALRGCTCQPETITRLHDGVAVVEVLHADDCPTLDRPADEEHTR